MTCIKEYAAYIYPVRMDELPGEGGGCGEEKKY